MKNLLLLLAAVCLSSCLASSVEDDGFPIVALEVQSQALQATLAVMAADPSDPVFQGELVAAQVALAQLNRAIREHVNRVDPPDLE